MSKLLVIKGLKTHYFTPEGVVKAVNEADLEVGSGETLGIAGESGCGKSTLGLSILRLVRPPGKIVGGEILLDGENLLEKSDNEMRKIRGARITTIFQDPTSSLNPVFTVGSQISEVIKLHQYEKKGLLQRFLDKFRSSAESEVHKKVESILKKVGISDASRRRKDYPHEFSGGMRQRAMIAMALSCHPDLLIADEPTTNLDVTIQAQILELMRNLRSEFGTATILITHDLGVLSEFCEKIAVMYAGKVVEYSDTKSLFDSPKHPYSEALSDAVPKLGVRGKRLPIVDGEVPKLDDLPPGCSFHPRCKYMIDGVCNKRDSPLVEVEPGIKVRCFKYVDEHELENW